MAPKPYLFPRGSFCPTFPEIPSEPGLPILYMFMYKVLNKHQQLIRNNKKPPLTLYASVAEVSTSVCTGTASLVFGRIVVGR